MVSDDFRSRFPGVELILFDAVGTVLMSHRPVAEVYHDFGKRFGSQRTRSQIRDRFHSALHRNAGRAIQPSWEGRPVQVSPWLRANTDESREFRRWRRIVADVFDDIPDQAGELFLELWHHFAQADAWEVHPDWSDTRTTLERLGLEIGIASNFDQRLLQLVETLRPLEGLRHLFVSARLGVSKPDPRFYQAIERQTRIGGQSVLLIGDDPLHDVIAPRQLGWQALWWSPHEPAASMQGLPRLKHFSDLIRFSPCDE